MTKIETSGLTTMKNNELEAKFAEQLKSGRPFIVATVEGKKSEKDGEVYFQFYIAQKITRESSASVIDKELLGWGVTTTIERSIRNAKLSALTDELATKYGNFKVGAILNGKNLEVTHTAIKPYEGATPIGIVDNNGESFLMVAAEEQHERNGEPIKAGSLIYKKVSLVGESVNDHRVSMVRVSESKFNSLVKTESVGELESTEMS